MKRILIIALIVAPSFCFGQSKCELERWLIKNHYKFNSIDRVISHFKIDTGEEDLRYFKEWVKANSKNLKQ